MCPQYIPVEYDPWQGDINNQLANAGYTVAPNGLAYQGPAPQERYRAALNQLMDLTGIPDLQAAATAAQRSEPLQAIGQGAYGLANLAALAAPVGKALQPALRAVPSMLMDTTGAIKYARPFNKLADIAADPNYVYHATSFDRLHSIAEDKKLGTFKPNYGTDQEVWPDGSTQKRNYWGNSPQHTDPFVPDFPAAVIRAPRDVVKPQTERYTNDLYSTKPVPSDKLEYWNGEEWRPLAADYNDLTSENINKAPIRAYHGSPYDFDAFDLSKIGTGEGAQAYGHGLYAAENESVAKGYFDALKDKVYATSGRDKMSGGDAFQALYDAAKGENLATARGKQFNLHPDQARAVATNLLKGIEDSGSIDQYLKDYDLPAGQFGVAYQAAAKKAQEIGLKVNPGHMYELNINADPDTFLHWDKPLSEQPAKIRQIVEPLLKANTSVDIRPHPEYPGAWQIYNKDTGKGLDSAGNEELAKQRMQEYVNYETHGEGLYKRLSDKPEVAADILNKAGISGIKYLDQGSRTSGEGTHNYVVFDPSMIEIIKKYGIAPLIAGGAYSLSDNQHLVPVDHDPFAE